MVNAVESRQLETKVGSSNDRESLDVEELETSLH